MRITRAGVSGGLVVLKEFHKVFVKEGDPISTLIAMRHSWHTDFDFGDHQTTRLDDHTVLFTVTDYPDMNAAHGHMIIGWDIAAAKLAGAYCRIRYHRPPMGRCATAEL